MTGGYTTRDMAGDYAQMISIDLGGYVEAAIGMSFGGMIAQHFAADYPELYGRLVIGSITENRCSLCAEPRMFIFRKSTSRKRRR